MNLNATLIVQSLAFAVFVWLTMKMVYPPIAKALKERQAKIAEGLASAERGARALQEASAQSDEAVKAARTQAQEIVAAANKQAAALVEQAKTTASTEAERIKTSARAEVDREVAKARETLRREVGRLAIVGASKILKREIDAKAHADVLDDLAARV